MDAWHFQIDSGRLEVVDKIDVREFLKFDAAAAALYTGVIADGTIDVSSFMANFYSQVIFDAISNAKIGNLNGVPNVGIDCSGSSDTYTQNGGTVWCDLSKYGVMCYKPVVNGGSYKGQFYSPSYSRTISGGHDAVSPVNSSGNALKCVSYSVAGKKKYDKIVLSWSGILPSYYGTGSLYTDAAGKLYFWVPESWAATVDQSVYTVTFNANGGVGGTTRSVESGKAVGTLPTPTRTDYTFLGWFTAASGGTQITASTKVTANVTFYAQWKANAAPTQTYILRLHRNNSPRDGATAGRTYTIGKARALPKIRNELKWAPRKGYDFLGWSKSANATTATYTDGQNLKDLTKTAGATVHLYGVWKAHKYIVRLHRNNSVNDGATTGRAFDYDQVRFLPTMAELKWVRSGYMFLGWSLAQNSSTVKYADGLNVYNLSANDGEELHVWGVWKKAEAGAYLLRLHRNNSERDGATAGRQLKLNANRKLPTVRELGWSRTDATFRGWATTAKNAAAGKVAYKDGATVRNLVSTQGDTAHLYAVWQ